jgi:hypothetical protein
MSTDKKSFFVDAKRVIGMQCNGQSKKEKNDKQWSKKNHFKVPVFWEILPLSEQNRMIKTPSPSTKF